MNRCRTYSARLVTFVDLVPRDTVMNDVIQSVIVTLNTSLKEAQFFVHFVVRFRELRVDAIIAARSVQATHF